MPAVDPMLPSIEAHPRRSPRQAFPYTVSKTKNPYGGGKKK
jgi:hypothetical protein